jgi:anaerobic selenocysteine-containing dehydrogenase
MLAPCDAVTGPGTKAGGPGFKARVSAVRLQRRAARGRIADEIETPGEGRSARCSHRRQSISSTPNSRRLDRAFDSLDFMAAIDIYVNETTRHADVILPPASMLAHENYDVVFNAFAIRNVARHNAAVFDKPEDALYVEISTGSARRIRRPRGSYKAMPIHGDGGCGGRAGPYAKPLARGAQGRGSVDLGRSRPRSSSASNARRKIACAPEAFVADLARVERTFSRSRPSRALLLVGRRHLRSNNSGCATRVAAKAARPVHLWIHPGDAAHRSIADGDPVRLASRVGEVSVTAR